MSRPRECSSSTVDQSSDCRRGVADVPFAIRLKKYMSHGGYTIPEIDTFSFLNNLLPPLKKGIVIEDILLSLKAEGLIDSRGTWTDGATFWREQEFLSLRNLFERSISASQANSPLLEQTIDLMLPDYFLESQAHWQRSSYFVLRGTEKRFAGKRSINRNINSWFNVAVPVALREKELYDDYQKYNTSKLISHVQKILTLDASRRHTFGITVEDTSMRLWFFSRGTPVVSKPFGLATEVHFLVHVFLSLAFASKEELGWDPTIRPFIRSDGKRAYYVDVDNETYVTEDTLANNESDLLVSRATRVWTVKRRGSEEPLVLKDVWVEYGRELEHDIYEAILDDVEKKYGVDVRKEVASHLLTPVAHCLVCVNGKEDHTERVMMRGYSPSGTSILPIDVDNIATVKNFDHKLLSSSDLSIQDPEDHYLDSPFPRMHRQSRILRRRHYRVVFKEVATGIHSIRSLSDIFTVLSDSTSVLKWIHGCGWIHRDLSVGNLYWYHGRGLIGDFEYAKRRNSDVKHELRTGTPDFMAVEASRRYFIYLPEKTFDHPSLDSPFWLDGTIEEIFADEFICPPFFHHDLHDLESLWWIAVWIFFTFDVASERELVEGRNEEQEFERKESYGRIFPGNSNADDRRSFLANQSFFENMTRWIPRRLSRIKKALNALRGLLIRKYLEFEDKFPLLDVHLFEEVHDLFRLVFVTCGEVFHDVTLIPYVDLRRPVSKQIQSPLSCHASEEHATDIHCAHRSDCVSKKRITGPRDPGTLRKRKREQDDDGNSTRPPCIPRLEPEAYT